MNFAFKLSKSFLTGHQAGRLLLLLASVSMLATAGPVYAQDRGTASISGKVISPATQNAFSGVLLRIPETGATTSTVDDGSFRFGNLPAGEYTIEMSYLGMQTETSTVSIASGEAKVVTLQLGPAALDEVVVTGIRGAQAAALNEQRTNDNISNVISSDQLGRFPDRNIAEAMRRIPGVAVEREEKAGDGRYVSIRGLDSGLNNFKLNGMNVAQQEEDNRRVALDVIQVEAVSKIVVNKTLLPNHDGDGIGGAVELVSATAFDYNDRYIDLVAEGFYNDFKEDLGGKIAGTFSNVFGPDERWGFLVSGTYSDRSTAGYGLLNDEDWVSVVEQDDDDPLEAGNAPEVYDFGASRFDNDRENIGINTAINFRATENTLLTFKGSYNKLNDTELDRGMFFVGDDDELYQGGMLNPEGGYTARITGEYEESVFRSQSYNFIGETQADRWNFDYSAGYSEGIRDEPNDYELSFAKDMQTSPILWNRSDSEFPTPELSAADQAAIMDPTGWSLSSNDIDQDRAEDKKFAVTFDAKLDLSGNGAFQYFMTGAKAQRSDRSLFEANVLDADGDLLFEEDGFRGEDVNFNDVGTPYAPIFAIDEGMLSDWRDIGFALVDSGVLENDYVDDGSIPLDEDTYDATEDVYAGYAMAQANFGRLELIGGVRVEHTRVSVNNLELIEDEDAGTETLTPITTDSDYTDVLPRLQVNFRATDDLIYRGAIFASLARPEFQYISGTTEIEIEGGTVDIFIGNPNLKPAFAWNFDFGVEYYIGGIGLLSANVFYKTIDDFIFNDDAPEGDFDPSDFANDPRFAGLQIGDVETYINGNSAEVYGLELNYMQQFSNLDGILSNFGVYFNLTLQDSSADSGLDGRDDVEFFNAPPYVGTAALTYQGDRLEANIAYSFRDKFLFGFSQFQESIYEQDFDSLDLTFSYDLTDRFRLTFRAADITDDGTKPVVRRTFGSSTAYLDNSNYNGRNFTFGVNARF
ncbi:MAG TPA: TonB-dependent receptor [Woeseiaceae bacterium]|nr:TonB-dependent receptor [Woeseiaceae bacterium]